MQQQSLNRISAHVYWLAPDSTTDRPTLGAIVGDDATLIVDAGNSPAHAEILLTELARIGVARPTYLVLTHWHWDHVFGLSAFDLPVFACEETQRVIEEMARLDWSDEALDRRVEAGTEIEFCRDMIKAEWPDRTHLEIVPPKISFPTKLEFNLGGVRCLVKHVGGDHASDSTIVHVREDKITFLGDCLYEDLHHGPKKYTTDKLMPLIDEIRGYNADYYILGHHSEPMCRDEMLEFTQRLRSISAEVSPHNHDRMLICQRLQEKTGLVADEETMELVDAFLAGLELAA